MMPIRARVQGAISLIKFKPFDVSSAEGRSKERYRRIALNSLTNLGTRGFGILVNLIIVPLTLSYLGKERYGLWSVITSFVTWVALFDFGIINGLVNALSEANGKDDREAAIGYVSTAFYLLVGIVILVGFVFAVAIPFIRWERVFAVESIAVGGVVTWSVIAAIAPILISMPLSVVRQIYAGYQKTYIGNLFYIIGTLFTLISMYLGILAQVSLPILILIFGSSSVVLALINMGYLVWVEMPWLSPRLAKFSRRSIRRLLDTSVPLFLFQLGALLVNSTQPIILAHRTNLGTVTDYSVLMKLYILFGTLIILSTNPFFPTFREAYERGDKAWMRKSFRSMLVLRMSLAGVCALVMVLGGDFILRIWLHQSGIHFTSLTWLTTAGLMLASTWATAFSDLLTIMDKIWVQVGLVLINGLLTAALTYFLTPIWGVIGAITAYGFTTFVLMTWVAPLLTRSLLKAQ